MAEKKKSNKLVTVAWTLIILSILLWIFVGTGDDEPEIPWYKKDNSTMAYIMTEDFVKQRLKSPSTAEFAEGAYRSEHVQRMDSITYYIDSWVDSQNSFGATIRTHFSAKIKNTEKEQWQLIELNFE